SRHAIWVGGGVVAGRFGSFLCDAASQTLQAAGIADTTLHRADHPSLLPLIGSARRLPPSDTGALVFDFGASFVKRAVASFVDGALVSMRLLTPVPTPAFTPEGSDDYADAQTEAIADALVAVMAATWQEAHGSGISLAPASAVSVAGYVRDGWLLPRQKGLYATLHALPERADYWLARQLSERVGGEHTIELLHDGTAAAQVYAGTPNSAVILLGTALGVGFPSIDGSSLRPLGSDFTIVDI
ncbi:MAG TPA: hypothetical protein VKQ36_06720, partial [Ktedonobacterales bacterium]|nr:hypothetical protein [Ktedonobacterales bacterium]